MKRRIYRLKWDKTACAWILRDASGKGVGWDDTKERAEWGAREYVRLRAPSQLLIYTKANRIGKGGRYEASYGCDSKKRKG